jgi:hypothetical protein
VLLVPVQEEISLTWYRGPERGRKERRKQLRLLKLGGSGVAKTKRKRLARVCCVFKCGEAPLFAALLHTYHKRTVVSLRARPKQSGKEACRLEKGVGRKVAKGFYSQGNVQTSVVVKPNQSRIQCSLPCRLVIRMSKKKHREAKMRKR